MKRLACLLLVLAWAIAIAAATIAQEPTPRHRAPIAAFRKANPCPSTGLTTGKCVGFVVDHLRPLCFGGADSVENLAWQEIQESYKKDAFERAACRLQRDLEALRAKLAACSVPD